MVNAKFSARNYLPLAMFVVLGIAGVWWLFHDGVTWTDFPLQWRVGAYTLRGVDIYSLRGDAGYIPEIGTLGTGFHAVPWGFLLANVFYGGFLPYNTAVIYFIAVNIAAIIAVSCLLYAKAKALSEDLGIMSFMVSLTSVNFFIAGHEGNAGGIICALLVIAWLICDEHPCVSGILIGLAMVKPQDAAIVCVALLLMKRFVPVIVAAVIDIAAWAAVSVILKRGMLELITEFLFSSDRVSSTPDAVNPFAGIFTLTTDNFLLSVAASMIFGIIFVYVMYRYLPADMPEMFKIYPPFMAMTFWSYSYVLDSYVLIIPACICLWLMIRSGGLSGFTFWMLGGLFCVEGAFIRSAIYRVFMRMYSSLNYPKAYDIARTIYELGIIAIGIALCLKLRHVYKEADS